MSSLCSVTKTLLMRFFCCVAELEHQLDRLRQRLSEYECFSPQAAFRALDTCGNKYLTGQNIYAFLRQHNALVTEAEVFHLVRQLDLNGDGRICYAEFLKALLPVDATARSSLISRVDCGLHSAIPHDCCFLLANLLMKEVEVNRELEIRRKVLFSRPDFKLLHAFRYLEDVAVGHITPGSFAEVFEAHNQHLNACDLELIFRRMDRDRDGKLSYLEFVEGLLTNNYTSTLPHYHVHSQFHALPPLLCHEPVSSSCICKDPSCMRACPLARPSSAGPAVRNYLKATSPRRRPLTTSSRCETCCRICGCHVCICHFTPGAAAPCLGSTSSSCADLQIPDVCRVLCRSLNPSCTRTLPRSLSSCARGRQCAGVQHAYTSPTRDVTHAFEHQIDMERRLDKFRKNLSMRPDFNLLDFWRLFDKTGKGYATSKEVEDAMRALHVHVSPHEAHLFIKQHSKAGDGKIRYVDMCNAFTPKDQRYADIMQNRLPDYRQYQCTSPQKHMSLETRELVSEVFHLLVVSEVQSESMRHQFSHHNLWHTFKMLDKDNDGFITADEFRSALKENNVHASENEVKALVGRYDTSMDGKVSYAEFVNELGITRCPKNICSKRYSVSSFNDAFDRVSDLLSQLELH